MRVVAARRIRRTPLAVAAAAMAVMAGCGGTTPGPGRAAYARQANRVCADGRRAVADLDRRITLARRGGDPDRVFADLAALTRRLAGAAAGYLDRLDVLARPAADRDALGSWIAGLRRRRALVATLGDAYARRDETAISTLVQRIDALDTTNNAFARRHDLGGCTQRVS